MTTQYRVRRAFAHEGTYYTRDNADAIAKLPEAERKRREKGGYIEEYEAGEAPDAVPASPAKPSGKEK